VEKYTAKTYFTLYNKIIMVTIPVQTVIYLCRTPTSMFIPPRHQSIRWREGGLPKHVSDLHAIQNTDCSQMHEKYPLNHCQKNCTAELLKTSANYADVQLKPL
jgi:hypothetical protein